MKKCKICGKEFATEGRPWNANLCSQECRHANFLRLAKAQQIRKKNTVVRRKCRTCGKEVISTAYCPQSFCGGKFGECFRKHLIESRKGRKNPAYRNGFAVAGKRTYTGIHLRACSKYRKAFLEKHGYLFCEVCGVNQNGTPKFEVHHIYFASKYPKHPHLHDFANLIMVCIGCHNDFHSSKLKEKFQELEKERGLKKLFNVPYKH